MTRMQKWEQYRLEIDQSSAIGQTIVNQSQKIEKYKREIDKINPAILQGIGNVNLNLHKGISEVIVSQKQIPDTISKMFKNLNKAKTTDNKNNIKNSFTKICKKRIKFYFKRKFYGFSFKNFSSGFCWCLLFGKLDSNK